MTWLSTFETSIFSYRLVFYGFIRSWGHMTEFRRGLVGFYWYFYDFVCRAIWVLLESRRLVSSIRLPLIALRLKLILWIVSTLIFFAQPAFVIMIFARYGFWTGTGFAISWPVPILSSCEAWTTCRLAWGGATGTAAWVGVVSHLSSLVSFAVLHKIE